MLMYVKVLLVIRIHVKVRDGSISLRIQSISLD